MKEKLNVRTFFGLFKKTFKSWSDREPFNNSVIIAYYTIFSLPGLLVIVINIAGYFYDSGEVTKSLSQQIGGLIGTESAMDVEKIVNRAGESKENTISTIISIATLLFGATGVFYQLQQILNRMWQVKPKPKQKFLKLVRDRLFSFGLILVVAFLLLISMVLSAALSAVTNWFSHQISESLEILFHFLDIVVSAGVITLLFAAMFKFLPDAKIRWRDVWVGALITSVLFIIAKFALGLYFGNTDPASAYGAAGTIILIMLWVSYSGLIVLFGAEFTQVYANHFGQRVIPTDVAVSAENDPKKESQTKSQ